MAKYIVLGTMSVEYRVEVDALDEDDAKDKAEAISLDKWDDNGAGFTIWAVDKN